MPYPSTENQKRMMNAIMRMASLATKFFLTLYMGRYFSLADLGTYGLVLGTSVFMNAVFGVRLDFVISREMVGTNPLQAALRIRDQVVFYGTNYLIFAIVIQAFIASGFAPFSSTILYYVLIIAIVENLATLLTESMVALGQPLLSNFLVFVRMGLWTLPVIGMGIWDVEYRNVNFLLNAWIVGVILSIGITIWCWRKFPWTETLKQPINWPDIKRALKITTPIWVGGMAGVAATYVDRFIVSDLLGIEKAGIVTFYASFSLTLLSVMQSGVFAFSYPKLIFTFKTKDMEGFINEAQRTGKQVFVFAGALAVFLGIAVPVLGLFLGRSAFIEHSSALWMLLAATWVRTNASTLSFILYARHQDREIWVGDLLSLVPTVVGNYIFVPRMDLEGIGISALLSALFLILWRSWHVRDYPHITGVHKVAFAKMVEILRHDKRPRS